MGGRPMDRLKSLIWALSHFPFWTLCIYASASPFALAASPSPKLGKGHINGLGSLAIPRYLIRGVSAGDPSAYKTFRDISGLKV